MLQRIWSEWQVDNIKGEVRSKGWVRLEAGREDQEIKTTWALKWSNILMKGEKKMCKIYWTTEKWQNSRHILVWFTLYDHRLAVRESNLTASALCSLFPLSPSLWTLTALFSLFGTGKETTIAHYVQTGEFWLTQTVISWLETRINFWFPILV